MMLYYNSLIGFLEQCTHKKYWRAKLLLLLVLFIHVFTTPGYRYIDFNNSGWKEVNRKKENLLAPVDPTIKNAGESHSAKMVLRLTVPVIAKILHLSPPLLLVLNFFIGILFLFLIITLSARITGDNVSGLLMGVASASVGFGAAAFGDFFPMFDHWAFLFLLLAMVFPSPVLIFLFTFLAAWTDERAFFASFFVYCWWTYRMYPLEHFQFKHLFRITGYTVALLLSVVSYAGLRFYLGKYYGLRTPMYDVLQCFMDNLPYMGISAWTYFQGFWLLVLPAAVLGVLKYPRNVFNYIFIFSAIAYIFGTFLIGDLTRSGGYCFPIVLVCLLLLSRTVSVPELRAVLLVSACVCVLFPALNVATGNIERWALGEPLPVSAFKHFYYEIWLKYIR